MESKQWRRLMQMMQGNKEHSTSVSEDLETEGRYCDGVDKQLTV